MTEAVAVAEKSAPEALSRGRINLIFGTIVLGMLMAALDQTIVSAALPSIVADLGGAGHMAWVVTAYMLTEAVATALAGKLGDLFGRKLIFQISGLIFIAGSAVAGLAHDMVLLIVARGVQGIGAGGLMVTAMALIADTIPLRERGKYQGALGAVFGITTVVGPTLGGLFTDHASWRWCFYVNVPIAIIMIALAARTIPRMRAAARPIIDYAGIGFVAAGVSCLILGLEFGGQEYPWRSWQIIGLFVASVVLLAAFVAVELRAREPMLPMKLFRSNVFTVCSILSFIVGFAMIGSLTFLPAYFQYVDGVSATMSGVRTLPLVVGLMFTSILSGQVVAKTGRYRYFPIVGTAVMALGLWLMSTMGRTTSTSQESLYMLVLGMGIGLSMQVLTIVVQNTVPYADLGTATSGVTFFRTLGSAFGATIFGTLYTNQLTPNLGKALAQSPGVSPEVAASPEALRNLPADKAAPIIDAYAHSIDFVFKWVVPVALLGFLVAWFLKQVPLRDSIRGGATDVGEGFSMPDHSDRVALLERAVGATMAKARAESGSIGLGILADAGSRLSRGQAWALGQIYLHNRIRGGATIDSIALAHKVPDEVIEPVILQMIGAGYVDADDGNLDLTAAGRVEVDRVHAAWRRWLSGRIDDWDDRDPADSVLLDEALDNVARKVLDDQLEYADARG
ncbi:MDR family MFS transporter [Nocardia goodfellowii]|uniref:EmrB/QacA subfamily drug resistance transporter n=1 Tax=Nocardia goodfellowii TaxID=882446 RepID=A0ABS4QS23_9NOCA|nr:MDR family MFS transporter [Nocardia goodfellowii]MBP2194477.1 EmrB/QacA subfamily drug resistance transporter [Nocardia goodfellowii]